MYIYLSDLFKLVSTCCMHSIKLQTLCTRNNADSQVKGHQLSKSVGAHC